MNFLSQKRLQPLLNKDSKMLTEKNPFSDEYYKDLAELTRVGGWSVNFKEKTSFLDPQARKILKTPEDYRASLRTAVDFYAPSDRQKATESFISCSMGNAFSETVKMITYEGKEFWAKATGKPMHNEKGEIYGIQGVFQDIDEDKLREVNLEKSIQTIESQNSRLFNFAHIVSHNLRSHSSNLHLTLELLKTMNYPEEEKELEDSLFDISRSLNDTINHLNEIVTTQSKSLNEKKEVDFNDVLQGTKYSISRLLIEHDVEIYSDFSEVPHIQYIPCYMESIFLNLITNAIKYRHPDRNPSINIFTFIEDGKPCLLIKDNGLGIDLDKFGDRLFNMYQTFHRKEDSVGICLFITKNQIETLQGSIEVESSVDVGTTFKIKF